MLKVKSLLLGFTKEEDALIFKFSLFGGAVESLEVLQQA